MQQVPERFRISRRHFLGYVGPAVAAGILVLPASARRLLAGDAPPSEGGGLVETPSDDEGPFYRAGAPKRSDLRVVGSGSPPLTVAGVVRAEDGKVLPGVLLDVWHADAGGAYDTESKEYRYRGTTTTDAQGRFRLETNLPGQYGSGRARRPRHVHVKFSGEGLYPLTTQMYFMVRPNLDAPEELVIALTWTGDAKSRAASGVWTPILSRKPAEAK